MARIRSIKPEFWSDRKLASLSRDARLLYIALWNQADEHGRCQGDTRWVKGHCFPYDDDLHLDVVDALISELVEHGRVRRYEVEGDPYLFLPKLGDHQRLEPTKAASKLPAPPNDPAQIFSDESARDSDESGKIDALHVAGSMEHAASADSPLLPTPTPKDLPGPLATLKRKCDKAGLTCRWDALNAEQTRHIEHLIETRGDARLVETLGRTWTGRLVHIQGAIGTWETTPPRGKSVAEVVSFCDRPAHDLEPMPCKACRADALAGAS